MNLKQLGERQILERIKKYASIKKRDVLLGIGDDCASVKFTKDESVLVTSDSLIENIHFDLKNILPFQLGWKAIAVNFSDIAAMAGYPKFVLISLAVPSSFSSEFIDDMYYGMQKLCSKYNVSIIGGDLCESKNDLVISVTAMGTIKEGLMVKRNGASIGDKIFVTGTVGDSSVGLDILRKDTPYQNKPLLDYMSPSMDEFKVASDQLVSKHIMPAPRIKEGMELAGNYPLSAMIDLSDGLVSGVKEICKQSGVSARIYTERLPLSKEAKAITKLWNKDITESALYGGEDYELLFTANIDSLATLTSGCPVSEIGEIVDREKGIILESKNNQHLEVIKDGYEHF